MFAQYLAALTYPATGTNPLRFSVTWHYFQPPRSTRRYSARLRASYLSPRPPVAYSFNLVLFFLDAVTPHAWVVVPVGCVHVSTVILST